MINNLERTDWLTDWLTGGQGGQVLAGSSAEEKSIIIINVTKLASIWLKIWTQKKIWSTVNYLHKLSQSMKAAEKTPLFCFAVEERRMVERVKQKNKK
jgi:peptidyl-tRNA hydrolase